jgi:hypothetical protein
MKNYSIVLGIVLTLFAMSARAEEQTVVFVNYSTWNSQSVSQSSTLNRLKGNGAGGLF